MILAILSDTQPPDFVHDPVFQFYVNIAVAILFSGILTSIVSIWIYRKQRQKKEISYEIISDAPVISVEKNVKSRVEIKLDGNPVKEVTLAVIKVLNTGNVAVKRDDYDKPLQILFRGRKVISAEVTETEPKDLIDQSDYKSFFLQPAQTQGFLEFPKTLLNRRQAVIFSVLLDGAKDKISHKGMIVDGDIVRFEPITKQRRDLLVNGAIYAIILIIWFFVIQGLIQILSNNTPNLLIMLIVLVVVTIISTVLLILVIVWVIKGFKLL